ncbi:hypothetical protein [Ensifer sesbaniae]|uniref:hypothetical protein n=1 Tax=Ensifer sesbaniae TaxID=1214071 RepID=UPI00156902B5|nr:hypothetical protein [Ensifer sesbaniae]NRQ17609.1 hypothetical protein [Ensifer sesbaniae]
MTNEIQGSSTSDQDVIFELDTFETEGVAGGVVAAIALGLVITHVPEITAFFDGFFEAL